jgi:hypothetical protein
MGKKPAKFSHLRACLYVCTIEGGGEVAHEGNAKEENNGYVVFKLKIVGTPGRQQGGGEGVILRPPNDHPPLLKASGQIYKDDVNGFSST